MKTTKISEEVMGVLRYNASVEGTRIMINRQLDRKLYQAVNKVLEAMGGKWDRKGHSFPEDPTAKLQAVIEAGELVEPKKNGCFYTPKVMADQVVVLAGIAPGMLILDPEAGQGALADAAAEIVGTDRVDCIEILPENVRILGDKGYAVIPGDFIDIEPNPIYDRIIMNPPFENQADIVHVLHAYRFLKPGGRLVAIMSAGIGFREDKRAREFRAFVEECDGWWEPNPEGSFKESGTMVNTVTVLLEGPVEAEPGPVIDETIVHFDGAKEWEETPPAAEPEKPQKPADIEAEETSLAIRLIYPNPNQPRKLFDQGALEELAGNIRQYGVLQPLVVTRRGKKYLLIAGERRWRAAQIAGRKYVPVRIIEADDAMVEELALLENIFRRDLNLIEEARGYQALLDRGYTVETLAAKLGFKQPWRVTERTQLLNLAGDYQDLVIKGILSPSQGFELSRVPKEKQPIVFRKIRNGELNGYDKLRSFVTALVNIEETRALFDLPEMSEEEKETLTSYERMIEKCTEIVRKAYEDNDLVVLKKVTRGNLQINIERLDMITKGLGKIKKVLVENLMQQEALFEGEEKAA